VALLGLAACSSRGQALTPRVRDGAGFFSPETVKRADEVIREVKHSDHKDLLVETFRHAPEGEQKEATSSDPKVKARFFADWAVRRARAEGVNGIYVLITREPGHVEVAVGNHTRSVFPDEDRHRLTRILLDHFKKKQYDEGLIEAVRYVRSTLASKTRTHVAAAADWEQPRQSHQPGGAGWSLWRWLGIGLAVLLGVWLLTAVIRALSGVAAQPAAGGYAGPGGSAGYGPGPVAGPTGGGGGGGFFSSLLG